MDVWFPGFCLFSDPLAYVAGVLVTSKASAPVGCLCSGFSSLQDLWGLDANIVSEVSSICVASGILGACLVSGIPSTVWPPT